MAKAIPDHVATTHVAGQAKNMYCIVALGNPEPRYFLTRHNIGFQIAEKFAESHNCTFRKGKGEYVSANCHVRGSNVLIVKPVTYMNKSGIAVQQVIKYFKIDDDKLLIVLDDLDLPFGTFRLRPHGGDAGNRGLRSIIRETGGENIPRLRIGIRNRDNIANPSSYVLSPFNKNERFNIPNLVSTAGKAVTSWLVNGMERAMNDYNGNHLKI